LCLPTIAEAKAWRGIVPLKSTRADVERLLGPPGKDGLYHFDEESAEINYAGNGPCNPVNTCLCFISETTVMSVDVELEVEMRFSALKIDKTKFKKFTSPQNPIIVTYSNEKEGIIYTVDHDRDEVIAIEYLPTAKDCKEIIRTGKPTGVESLRPKTIESKS
jgi:hypothetical protein